MLALASEHSDAMQSVASKDDGLRRLKADPLMVSDVEEQHFRISGENASRFQADTRLSGYSGCIA